MLSVARVRFVSEAPETDVEVGEGGCAHCRGSATTRLPITQRGLLDASLVGIGVKKVIEVEVLAVPFYLLISEVELVGRIDMDWFYILRNVFNPLAAVGGVHQHFLRHQFVGKSRVVVSTVVSKTIGAARCCYGK